MDFTPPAVVVIGSANMDLVVSGPAIPRPGETVLAKTFSQVPGGKGANQAVAAARLGGRTAMIGRVGADAFGPVLRAGLQQEGVDCRFTHITEGVSSGVAFITVADNGQNAICVVPGANDRTSPQDVQSAEALLRQARICVLQLEIPLATVAFAIQLAHRHQVPCILDPAPAPDTAPPELFDVDVLTPNETEAARLLGVPEGGLSPLETAARLRDRGARAVVLKLGAAGAYYTDGTDAGFIPAHPVRVVDTTAAGDAFTAGLAVALTEGRTLAEATRVANAAGALACTRFGAQPSAPARAEVERLLQGT